MRLQPYEAVYLKANMKEPGLNSEPQQVPVVYCFVLYSRSLA